MLSLVDVLRLGSTLYSWTSCLWKVDGQDTKGLVACDYEQKRERKLIPGSRVDQPPIGMTVGKYGVTTFTIKMLKDSANALITYLATKGLGSYGDASFTFNLQCLEPIVPGQAPQLPLSVVAIGCKIVGKKDGHEEGVDELLTELEIATLCIFENGKSLANAGPFSTPIGDAIEPLCRDYVTMGLFKSPGKCVIRRAGSPRKWDIREGYGTSGASLVYNGQKVSQFEIDIYIWELVQFLDWQVFAAGVPLGKSPLGVIQPAIGIDHPLLNSAPLSISQVVIEDVSQWEQDDFGLWKCTIKVIEYRAPQPALAVTTAGIPAATAPIPTAEDAADESIQKMSAEVDVLAAAP